MDQTLERALQPGHPGRLVRALRVLPGVKATADQIEQHSARWRAEAELAIAAEGPVAVVLGDSLSQGIGAADVDSSYPARVCGVLEGTIGPTPILNLSRSGARIGDILDTQLPALHAATVQTRIVMCTVGNNDLLRSARLGHQRQQMTSLLAGLPAKSLVATLPAAGSIAARRFNAWLRAEAPSHGIVLADVDRLLTRWRGLRAADGFHPNEDGYTYWVRAFLDAWQQTERLMRCGTGATRFHPDSRLA